MKEEERILGSSHSNAWVSRLAKIPTTSHVGSKRLESCLPWGESIADLYRNQSPTISNRSQSQTPVGHGSIFKFFFFFFSTYSPPWGLSWLHAYTNHERVSQKLVWAAKYPGPKHRGCFHFWETWDGDRGVPRCRPSSLISRIIELELFPWSAMVSQHPQFLGSRTSVQASYQSNRSSSSRVWNQHSWLLSWILLTCRWILSNLFWKNARRGCL